jgi:hypothetical protein
MDDLDNVHSHSIILAKVRLKRDPGASPLARLRFGGIHFLHFAPTKSGSFSLVITLCLPSVIPIGLIGANPESQFSLLS